MAAELPAVFIVSNLLLLLAVGMFDRRLIGRERLDVFTSEDFIEVAAAFELYPRRLTTPHVLSELGNLAGHCIPAGRHREFRIILGKLIAQIDERWMPAAQIAGTDAFSRLGLTDAAIVLLADQRTTVISVDLDLCVFLSSAGVEVENFNHWRRP